MIITDGAFLLREEKITRLVEAGFPAIAEHLRDQDRPGIQLTGVGDG